MSYQMFRLRINNLIPNYTNQEEGLQNFDDTDIFMQIISALVGAIHIDRHRNAKSVYVRILPTLDNDNLQPGLYIVVTTAVRARLLVSLIRVVVL